MEEEAGEKSGSGFKLEEALHRSHLSENVVEPAAQPQPPNHFSQVHYIKISTYTALMSNSKVAQACIGAR